MAFKPLRLLSSRYLVRLKSEYDPNPDSVKAHRIARSVMNRRLKPWFCHLCLCPLFKLGVKVGEGNTHHEDGNDLNNEDNNLMLLCVTCHRRLHTVKS